MSISVIPMELHASLCNCMQAKKIQKDLNFRKLQEASGSFRNLQEPSGSFRNLKISTYPRTDGQTDTQTHRHKDKCRC